MLRARPASRLRNVLVHGVIVAITVPFAPLVQGAEQKIDLDGNPANGAESTVKTVVLSTFPVEVENTITNNATGESLDIIRARGGPGEGLRTPQRRPGTGCLRLEPW